LGVAWNRACRFITKLPGLTVGRTANVFTYTKQLLKPLSADWNQPGFYVVAVEAGVSRRLTADEDKIVDPVRFGKLADSATP
jgi:hypothetical protein